MIKTKGKKRSYPAKKKARTTTAKKPLSVTALVKKEMTRTAEKKQLSETHNFSSLETSVGGISRLTVIEAMTIGGGFFQREGLAITPSNLNLSAKAYMPGTSTATYPIGCRFVLVQMRNQLISKIANVSEVFDEWGVAGASIGSAGLYHWFKPNKKNKKNFKIIWDTGIIHLQPQQKGVASTQPIGNTYPQVKHYNINIPKKKLMKINWGGPEGTIVSVSGSFVMLGMCDTDVAIDQPAMTYKVCLEYIDE